MDASDHTFISESGLPAQRRRKVRLACNPCRARKTGCDGSKPVCTACALRGWDERCHWQDSVMPTSSALSLVDLDRRIQRLESGAPRPSARDLAAPLEESYSFQPKASDSPNGGEGPLSQRYDTAAALESNQCFMRHAVSVAGPTAESLEPGHPVAVLQGIVPNILGFQEEILDPSFGTFDRRAIVLPLQSFADSLLRWYWKNYHSIFPILHWPSFMAEYAKLWAPSPSASPSGGGRVFEELVFHATLNMVLALGCQRSESLSVPQREFHASEFYKRSQRLISIETLDASSVSVVQLLLLRAMYLYYASLADRCWVMLGAAIRVAVGMGLHAGASRRTLTQLDREMRLRVWHFGCVTLDHIYSSAFGRPTMTYQQMSTAPLPQAIDDEYLSTTTEGRQPDGKPARLESIVYTMKSVKLMEDMRAVQLTSNLRTSQDVPYRNEYTLGPDPSAILRIYSRVDDLLDGAPEHIRPGADNAAKGMSEEDVACFRMQGQVLRSRMLQLKLLLLRPSLLAEAQRWNSASPPPERPSSVKLEERFQQEICTMCLSTVHMALEEVHGALHTFYEFPAWYALQLCFGAAAALVAASLSPALGVDFEVEPARSSWQRAMDVMERYQVQVPSAERGMQVLKGFRKHLEMRVKSRSNTPRWTSSHQISSNSTRSGSIGSESLDTPRDPSEGNVENRGAEASRPPEYPYHFQSQASTSGMGRPPGQPAIWMAMEGMEDFMNSQSLNQAWFTTQDDWMARFQ